MSDILPVVWIKSANGPVEINECDFDPAKHELHNAKQAPEQAAPVKAAPRFSRKKKG